LFVPGPVDMHVALASQAPRPAVQLLIALQVFPFPE
jgi:hypothetical protein